MHTLLLFSLALLQFSAQSIPCGVSSCYCLDNRYADWVEANKDSSPAQVAIPVLPVANGGAWQVDRPTSVCSVTETGIELRISGGDRLSSPLSRTLTSLAQAEDTIEIDMLEEGCESFDLSWISDEQNSLPVKPVDAILDSAASAGSRAVFKCSEPDPGYATAIRVPVTNHEASIKYSIPVGSLGYWQNRNINQICLTFPGAMKATIRSIDIRSLQRRVGACQYTLNGEVRPCLFMRPDGAVRYELTVPENGLFSAGLGVGTNSKGMKFSVQVGHSGVDKTVFEQEIADDNHWHRLAMDLSEWAGKTVTLALCATSEAEDSFAIWSNPSVLARTHESGAHPNIVLYVIDALRYDHLDAYGYSRATAPNIAKFAKDGVIFNRCLSNDTWAISSVSSFLTGVDSFVHLMNFSNNELSNNLIMFPEVLRERGYMTGVISNNEMTPPRNSRPRTFSCVSRGELIEESARILNDLQDRNFFLYIHAMECHGSGPSPMLYNPPEPYKSLWASAPDASLKDFYDGGVSHSDHVFGEFLANLEKLGLTQNTLVILTADHGEAFGEHGLNGHGSAPYNVLIRVPLIMRWPQQISGGQSVDVNVQLLDLAPTVMEATGITKHHQFQGMSLLPLLKGGDCRTLSERTLFQKADGLIGAINKDYKLLTFYESPYQWNWLVGSEIGYDLGPWDSGPVLDSLELYNIKDDPGETMNLTGPKPKILAKLLSECYAHLAAQGKLRAELEAKPKTFVDYRMKEIVESLGYLR